MAFPKAILDKASLDELYEVVGRLIAMNAKHRSGVEMATVPVSTILDHMTNELIELKLAVEMLEGDEAKEELCDLLGVVLHLAHKFRLTPQDLYLRCCQKFTARFM